MSEDKDTKTTSNTRRKALKAIGAGGVIAGTIPGSWTTPVVKSVLLPAHAQTSAPACSTSGPCQSGMSVNILSAVVVGSGGLFVIGEAQIPGGNNPCWPDDSSSVVCEVIDEGAVLESRDNTSAGGNCSVGSINGCLVSCSVLVSSADNTLTSGDCVTLRVTFNGACICSGVTTVA
ncbi:MAG: twin-arginine translocation signal domain-containing protein [Gammaproteobacteria bacterium]|nr:twin-arginine translocation signal domain-containing protein [Gammaproteobacteria bacterium]